MYPFLETERTVIRPYNDNDIETVIKITGEKSVKKVEKMLADTLKYGKYWVVILKETQMPIGWVLCDKASGYEIQKRAFINAWLREEYRRQGFGREVLGKILNFTFFGLNTKMTVANAKNCEKPAYNLLSNYGFEVYNYVPKSKPNDDNTLVQFCISRNNYLEKPNVRAGTYDYELPKNPYNYENPIRKINGITFIEQPTEYLCGQAVIAMLANVSVEEVVEVMLNDKGTSVAEVSNALKYYGFKTKKKTRTKYTEGTTLPDCCVLSVRLPTYGHWSLYYKGKYYDPEFGVLDDLPKNAKLISYWEILD